MENQVRCSKCGNVINPGGEYQRILGQPEIYCGACSPMQQRKMAAEMGKGQGFGAEWLRNTATSMLLLIVFALPALAQKSQSYTLTVVPAPCAVTITTATIPQAQATVPYSFQFAATSTGGCALPLVFTASAATGQTGLPSGLTLSASGLLSGTIPSSYCTGTTCPAATFTLTVKDQSGLGEMKGIVKDGRFVASNQPLPHVIIAPYDEHPKFITLDSPELKALVAAGKIRILKDGTIAVN